jgi:hypothetical protein
MKKLIILGICIYCFSAITFGQNKVLPNTFYKAGESLKYVMRYGFISGGEVKLETINSNSDSNSTLHIRGTAYTTGIADKLFRVRDVYESYTDVETGLPVLAIQDVKEGKSYKYFNQVSYNRKNSTVTSTKSGEHKVPENIMDMISVFYYARRLDYSKAKEGDVFKLSTFFSDKEFPMELRYRGKETIETDFGYIRCLKFAPVVEPGRVFKSKDDMYVWFSDDDNRIIAKATLEMIVGHVTIELKAHSGLANTPGFFKKK